MMQNTLSLTRENSKSFGETASRGRRLSQVQTGTHTLDTLVQPNGRTFIELLTAFRDSGGTAPGEVVGRLLAEYQCSRIVSLATLMEQRRVLSFDWRGCRWFPMFQFELSDWSLKSGPHQVCKALPQESSSWTIAIWFATPNTRLEGHIPANMIDTDLPAVLDAASTAEKRYTCAVPSLQDMFESQQKEGTKALQQHC